MSVCRAGGRVSGRGFRSNRPQCAATRATPYRRSTPARRGRRSRAKRRCPRQCWLTGFGGRRPFAQWVDTALRPISFRSIAPTEFSLPTDWVDRGLDREVRERVREGPEALQSRPLVRRIKRWCGSGYAVGDSSRTASFEAGRGCLRLCLSRSGSSGPI